MTDDQLGFFGVPMGERVDNRTSRRSYPTTNFAVHRAEGLNPFDQAEILFRNRTAKVILGSRAVFKVKSGSLYGQVRLMVLMLEELSPLFSCIDSLKITGSCDYSPSSWEYIEKENGTSEKFPSIYFVRSACVKDAKIGSYVAHTLRELAREGATEVLPALRILTLQVQVEDVINPFLAMRELSNRPVTAHWKQVPRYDYGYYQ
ncbi:hypothetical protein BC826DRAFT_1108860 [Russula brevipes]|nr:hypothetical protein BC826DRAFT_1108860 [Russula brevipes]